MLDVSQFYVVSTSNLSLLYHLGYLILNAKYSKATNISLSIFMLKIENPLEGKKVNCGSVFWKLSYLEECLEVAEMFVWFFL